MSGIMPHAESQRFGSSMQIAYLNITVLCESLERSTLLN
jgi:hypothetical protein